jgi:hypothetical protein
MGSVVCYPCSEMEKNRQRHDKGSVTQKQVWYIERLIKDMDTKTTGEIIYSVIPDYSGDLNELSTQQGKNLIAKLMSLQPKEGENV